MAGGRSPAAEARFVRQRGSHVVSPILVYPFVIAVGAACGYPASRVSGAVDLRGRIALRLLRPKHLIFGLGALPSVALALFLGNSGTQGATEGQFEILMVAAAIPYALSYFAGWYLHRPARVPEGAFPYEQWYALRTTDEPQAEQFMTALWRELAATRAKVTNRTSTERPSFAEVSAVLHSQIADLRDAQQHLQRVHAGESALPAALAELEARIKRLENDSAALLPRG